MKKILLVLTILVLTLGFSTMAFAVDTSAQLSASIDNSIATDTSKDAVVAPTENIDDVIKTKEIKSFKKLYATEIATLATLRATSKTNWDGIKAKNTEIKNAFTSLKATLKGDKSAKTVLTALKAKLTTYRATIATIHTDMKAIRTAKITAWTEFRAAMKAKDNATSKIAIDKILSLKSQIIEKQKLLLNAKIEMLNAINAAVPVK